ncbi:MAG: hypothetical protein Q7V63_05460 [Gammaproteobacteria bacterium]|nr:hypothetical protein [Gammaproteobacteria bacterium]
MNGTTTAADKILEQVRSHNAYGFIDEAGTNYILEASGSAADALSDAFNKLVEACGGVKPHEAHVSNRLLSTFCTASNGDETSFGLASSSDQVNADGQCMVSAAKQVIDSSGLHCQAIPMRYIIIAIMLAITIVAISLCAWAMSNRCGRNNTSALNDDHLAERLILAGDEQATILPAARAAAEVRTPAARRMLITSPVAPHQSGGYELAPMPFKAGGKPTNDEKSVSYSADKSA